MERLTGPVSADGGLLVGLDRAGAGALHEQLEAWLREQIRSGRLAPGTRIPSSRALARALGISRGVVLEAYGQLTAEGYLTASQGAPTRVAAVPGEERLPLPASSLELRRRYDLRPSIPDLHAFPRRDWLRAVRSAIGSISVDALGYGDPRGLPELRNALMSYLGRARGAAPEPEHTLICAGFAEGFEMLCRTLADRGVERVAVEAPGWPQHRLTIESCGLEAVPVAVDAHGLDVAELAASDCEVVVLTPAHQYPTGVVLSSERRAALLELAEDRDGLIVEDDYDSELRFDRLGVGALQGLAPERVCHIGSLSKRLAPALRIGWILTPSWLTGALTFQKGLAGAGAPGLDQLALTDFIARGELERHLRRMRLRYRARRSLLLRALAQAIPDAEPRGIPAGLHVFLGLPEGLEDHAVLSAAAARGLALDAAAGGLVLGYGNLSEAAIPRAARLLGDAVAAARS